MTFLKEYYKDMNSEEELEFFSENCEMIYKNVRYYLDHLDDGTLWVYRTSFIDYKRKVKKE